jgi:hypothetical protein
MKNIIIICVAIAVLGGGAYVFLNKKPDTTTTLPVITETTNETSTGTSTTSVTQPITPAIDSTKTVIGTTVKNNPITAYHYGSGTDELIFIGGIHGGYEWNTVLLARQLMEYLSKNPTVIPNNIKVTVIPVLNPDGLAVVTGTTDVFTSKDVSLSMNTVTSGRFNANKVDLNRNFDCDWQKEGVWQTKTVSGGSSAFSEPESQAIKKYIDNKKPTAVVVWYSAAGGVFASNCHDGVSAETSAITKLFAKASTYPEYESFDFYATTGDMVNWLAKKTIPAISVILTNHTDTEWDKNKAGVEALLKHYAK